VAEGRTSFTVTTNTITPLMPISDFSAGEARFFLEVAIAQRFSPPVNNVKILKGWPPRDAPSELVQMWYKTFPPDQRGLTEMKNLARLSSKSSTA